MTCQTRMMMTDMRNRRKIPCFQSCVLSFLLMPENQWILSLACHYVEDQLMCLSISANVATSLEDVLIFSCVYYFLWRSQMLRCKSGIWSSQGLNCFSNLMFGCMEVLTSLQPQEKTTVPHTKLWVMKLLLCILYSLYFLPYIWAM